MATVRKRTWGAGKEAWILTYKDSGGKRRQETFKGMKAANIRRREVEHEIDLGIHTVRSETVTVSEALDLFMKECERRRRLNDKMSGNTFQQYRNMANIIAPALGGVLLSDLTFLRLQQFINEISRDRVATAHQCAMVLKIMLAHAVEQNLLKRSQLTDRKLRLPPYDRAVRFPEKADLMTLIEALDVRKHKEKIRAIEYRKAMVMLALFAGLRRGEIGGLQWENLDFINSVIEVRHSFSKWDGLKSPKTKSGIRDVPMVPCVREALVPVGERAFWPKSGFVFTSIHGKPVSDSITTEYFKPAMVTAGIDGKFNFHALRHAAISLMIEQGMPHLVVAKIAGHSKLSMTVGVYAHLFDDASGQMPAMQEMSEKLMLPRPMRTRQGCDKDAEVIDL